MSAIHADFDLAFRSDSEGETSRQVSQYVSFIVGDASYAVDIMSVREIKGWTDITGLPNQPDYVRGVLNLRGAVLPIVDLARRLGEDMTDTTPRHVVVIVTIEDRQVGLLVDAVSDILDVADDQIKPVPESGSKQDSDLFKGFLTEKDEMVAMLKLDSLLSLPTEGAEGQNVLSPTLQ